MNTVDYLIVGQGLAGSNLAMHLLDEGKSIIIVDKKRDVTSSKVAAGLMNPITGRRFAKTWLADKIFPYANQYYQRLEHKFNSNFFHLMPIIRYFGSIEDQNTWMGRTVEPGVIPYVGEYSNEVAIGILNEYGGARINQGGWLDTNKFLETCRQHFEAKNLIIDESLKYEDIHFSDGKVSWKQYEAEKIIFCEGFRADNNPYFDWLPFTFAKGEILDIKIDGISNNVIHNKNGFLLPVEGDLFKAGATFRWNEMDELPTKRSLIELKEKIENFTNLKYQIIDQKASIRPTTKDRRPFIGSHPNRNQVAIFNGFGSKGVTLTPYLAHHFVEVLEGKTVLEKELNIGRFSNLL